MVSTTLVGGAGTATALELAQAQPDPVDSELSELEAMVDYRPAQVKLFRTEGTLVERRGQKLDGSDGPALRSALPGDLPAQ